MSESGRTPATRWAWMVAILAAFLTATTIILPVPCTAQASSVSKAREVSPVTGAPSTVTIKKNFLEMQQASLSRDIKVAVRCLENARYNFRDSQGNIDRVASIDLVNCSKRLELLTLALQRLAKKAGRLGSDAEAEAMALESYLRNISSNQDFPD